jgi:hypothetical protein
MGRRQSRVTTVARTSVLSPSPKSVDVSRANASGQLARQRGVAASMSARAALRPQHIHRHVTRDVVVHTDRHS